MIAHRLKLIAQCSLLCLCVLAAPIALAKPEFLKTQVLVVVVVDPFVEVHTGPGRGYPVFHVVEKGQSIKISKRHTDWYKMQTVDGHEGWVHRDELEKTLGPDGSEIDFNAPNWQDFVDRRWELGVLGGTFEDADSFTNYLAFHLTHHIAFEAKYTQTFSSVGNNKLASLNLVHQPFPQWKLSPFFTLGSGRIDISPSSDLVQTEERENPVYTVGGGAFFYITRRFLMRVEFNNHTLLTKRGENEEVDEWKAGFSVFF